MATDFKRLDAMTDEDIDCSDIAEMTDHEIRNTEWIIGLPGSENVYFSIDRKLVEHFRKSGKGYLNRMNILVNSLLEDYVESHSELSSTYA